METRFTLVLNWISRFCLYLAVFLVPLFFLPFTLEKLELNKFFLFYTLTIISLLAWIVRSATLKAMEIKRTPLDVPLAFLWAAFGITSLLAPERFLSFFGDFSALHVSFVGLTLLLVFFWLVVQHIESIQQIIKMVYALLVSGALSALYFIISIAKIISFPNWLPPFNVVNATNSIFGVFMLVVFVLALTLLAIKTHNPSLDIFALIVTLLSGAVLVIIGFKILWIITALSLFFMLVFFLTNTDKVRMLWSSFVFVLFVVSVLFIFLDVPRFLTANIPIELTLRPGVSWRIAFDTITSGIQPFLLGSGPGTYQYAYSQFRPASLNLDRLAWNIRLNQPWSSALEWLTTGGVLSSLLLVSAILIVLGLIFGTWIRHVMNLKSKRKTTTAGSVASSLYDSPLLFWGIVTAWLTLTIAFFMFNFGAVLWVLWWLFTALTVVASVHVGKAPLTVHSISLRTSPQYALVTSFSFILICTVLLVGGLYLGRFYAAEVVYAKALGKAPDEKISTVQSAIGLNNQRALFQLTLADAFLGKAADTAKNGGDTNQIYQMVALAVQAAKNATDISPRNVATWEFLSTMYANARPIAPDANSWVISSLERARDLEPTNPLFYLGLGNAHLLEKNFVAAKKNFEAAINAKPDLLGAYMQLALTSELSGGNLTDSINTMEKGLGNGGTADADFLVQTGRYYFNRKQSGDLPLAELAFRRALGINPNNSNALFALAVLSENVGNRPVALELYKKVLELNPDNKDAQRKVNALSPATAPAPDTTLDSTAPKPKKHR